MGIVILTIYKIFKGIQLINLDAKSRVENLGVRVWNVFPKCLGAGSGYPLGI